MLHSLCTSFIILQILGAFLQLIHAELKIPKC